MQRVTGTPVDLAGDSRYDSPGHSAKYCKYAIYAAQIGRILHCEHDTVNQVSNTPTREMIQARTAMLKLSYSCAVTHGAQQRSHREGGSLQIPGSSGATGRQRTIPEYR